MIDSTTVCFPNNVCSMITQGLQTIDSDLRIVPRPIRSTDQTETVSVIPGTWAPDQDSHEIGRHEPTIQRYTVVVEALVVDMDEERAIATHSLLSSLVRLTLYRDPGIRAGLPLLAVNLSGYSERLKRWGVSQQRFMNNQVGQNFVHLSAVDFWFETEIESI